MIPEVAWDPGRMMVLGQGPAPMKIEGHRSLATMDLLAAWETAALVAVGTKRKTVIEV